MRLLATWLSNVLGLLIAAAIVPAISYGGQVGTLLLAAVVLGVVNFAVRPVIVLLTLPAVLLSFGVALLFINTLTLWLTSQLVSQLAVGGFWSTFAGAVLISAVNLALRPWRAWSEGPRHPRRLTVRWR